MILNPNTDLRTRTLSEWGQIFLTLRNERDVVSLEVRRCILYQMQQGYVGPVTIAMTKPACALSDHIHKELTK